MQAQVKKWGNSQGIRLPKEIPKNAQCIFIFSSDLQILVIV